ncbi:DUF899 domain-containing protein [Synechococcales cyanobacterium C]|uniref:DUF899 domain-containing protein n=1 Tax=Petrachloros mirabilis ULC683 TaxID=2781853 RepID=A0A8K1ZZV6_9CYAN|nr:DUF899 domain-containing protein [Petrachloros mirabilis]NCJ07893.1 DUF899 domain-containing protein [Petrachloros mirabilis ULC683]
MKSSTLAHPPVVSQATWLTERKALLAQEKKLTNYRDQVNAQRRRLPMVKLTKEYRFDSPSGTVRLIDLFAGRQQLIVYHFMFDPAWDKGCSGCTGLVNALGNLTLLSDRGTTFVLISRAPLEKLERYKAQQGWTLPWVSSFRSDFNYDFHVTQDPSVAPIQYNYRNQQELEQRGESYFMTGENHGLSVFFRLDDDVFHTYSTYARGVEGLTNAYSLLDVTPYGRQEDFEESPPGWPQKPTYGD